ncbi:MULTISPECIES: ion channel [unclassified Undibacterium]|uniref:ion channel n=1 Tax=unclassified Undibacterium TaxID=2630295 RepID=UPI002AC9CB99|nr:MULTISPECIES: ion channel [unclassified Undibacterium]MEB0139389.1 ion channel [Undibacterium sp. CCC2.1]MEB0173346.1 ion channel [Undibacterium sp. CCC1.1]MEB0177267.1 ion channel [Undibacterium sp. CCC3.4]MEB0216532.1 ion channel [Undibacterium sp. 5I2]WPX44040.1 ion channel [Undibacterium sp. CCC3.4]
MRWFSARAPRGRRISMGGRDVLTFGLGRHVWQDVYYYAMTSSWPMFFAAVAVVFLLFNLIFASLYLLGSNPIANLAPDNFLGAFFFSVETLATVGYGDMHPQSVYAHVVATLEIFVGMASVALTTGVMFARFSRPRSSIVFARHPVSHVVDGRLMLMIRLANARMNIISEAAAKLRLIRDEPTATMGSFRKIHELVLEREQHPIFMLGWTVMHVIDSQSPLYGLTPEQLQASNAALILSIEGIDDTTNQSQRARQYYPSALIHWNHRYVDIMSNQGSVAHLHYAKFHDTEELHISADETMPAEK